MRASLFSLVILFGAAVGSSAQADDSTEAVVVTATRTPQPAQKTGESVSIIPAQQLDTQQIVAVTDALQEIPGITIVRNGGLGQNATASIIPNRRPSRSIRPPHNGLLIMYAIENAETMKP